MMRANVMVMVVMAMVVIVSGSSQGEDIEVEPADNNAAMDNWIARLYRDKMLKYNKNVRPVRDHSKPTTVTLGLSLMNIELDDENQEFSVNAWAIMTWKDEFLHWVPVDYMNIDRLHFDDDSIWLPDITIYNSAEGSEAHPFGTIPVLVDSKGQAYWFPPTHLSVKCDLDLTNWPRDEHECLVRMGSWSHHGEQIDIEILAHNDSYGVMTDTLEDNNRWELVSVSATRAITSLEGHDPYVEINFSFWVRRQARTHAIYITQSTLAVVVVVLASYILPLDRFLSRLLMHLFSLGVLIACFFTLFALLPASGGPVPLVVRYYSGSIILTTLSMLATFFLLTRSCCCCCGSSSSISSSSKTLASIVTSPSRLRRVVSPQSPSSAGGSAYNHLENEVTLEEEEEEEQRRPRATQLNQVEGSPGYSRMQEEVEVGGDGHVDQVTTSQFVKIINFLLLMLFTVAFVVDYVVLRNTTL